MLNIVINIQPTPDIVWLWNSRLAAKHLSRCNFSIQLNTPRNFLRNSLDHMKLLPDPALIQSPCKFWTAFVLYIQSSMSLCWSQPSQTQSPIESSLPHHQSWLMTNPSLKSRRSWTPRLTIAIAPANYSTLSTGQVTNAPMKKLCGYSLPS